MNTLKKIFTALTFSTLCVAFTSSANPITSWDFIVDTAIDNAVYTAGTGTPSGSDINVLFGAPTILSWGETAQSSLDVSSGSLGRVTGIALPSGTPVQTSLLTHNNFPIASGSSVLSTATLKTILQIVPNGGTLPLPVLPPFLAFNILFTETSNSDPCAYVSVPCSNDIFVMQLPSGVDFNAGTATINQQFSIGAYNYNTELKIMGTVPGTGLNVLDNAICARVVGAGDGCIGLTTIEGQTNNFRTMMTISTIPEPTSILLMSLALFGIFASSRNKHI